MTIQFFLEFLWTFFQIAIGYNLVLPFLLLLIYAIIGNNKKKGISENKEADYAIIVTAYEQTTLIPSVVASLLKLNYRNYLIYVVADKCDITGLHFDDERVMSNQDEVRRLSEQVMNEKMLNLFKDKVKAKTKEVNYDEFIKAMYGELKH